MSALISNHHSLTANVVFQRFGRRKRRLSEPNGERREEQTATVDSVHRLQVGVHGTDCGPTAVRLDRVRLLDAQRLVRLLRLVDGCGLSLTAGRA